uniref:Uncharacterized protein n=1 Tax=viral metagenome TaxID=1070528 RepID=A0A6H1ZNH1_9ZZZZ
MNINSTPFRPEPRDGLQRSLADLKAIAVLERQRQATVASQAKMDGGLYDHRLGRFIVKPVEYEHSPWTRTMIVGEEKLRGLTEDC